MGNKPKWNEALSEAMRGQIGTTREVFTNSNGSNVILERVGDKWKRDNSEGSPDVDFEDEEEPEEEPEDEDDKGVGCGTNPNPKPFVCGTNLPPQKKIQKVRISEEFKDVWDEPTPEKQPNFFNGKTNAKNEKIKNVYEAMKQQIDEQLNHYYKTGRFTIDPTTMMNHVFSNIMSKYGYKSIFNNWFKNIAQKRTWIKKAWETWQNINPAALTKKLTGKFTVKNIGNLLKLKQTTINKLSHVFKLGKILKNIRANPVKFIVDSFAKTGAIGADMTSLISAFGSADAGSILSYVITLLIT